MEGDTGFFSMGDIGNRPRRKLKRGASVTTAKTHTPCSAPEYGAVQGVLQSCVFAVMLQERAAKVEAVQRQLSVRLGMRLGMSPGSKTLLKHWKTKKVSPQGCTLTND